MADSPEWICRIPRAHLRKLAASAGLQGQLRVLVALLPELYERTDKAIEAPVSRMKLARLTGLNERTIRRALADLVDAGALEEVPVSAGKTKRYRLAGWTQATHSGQLDVHPQDQKRPPYPARLVSTLPGAQATHPGEEEKKEELLEECARARKEVVKNSENGYARRTFSEIWATMQAKGQTGAIQ